MLPPWLPVLLRYSHCSVCADFSLLHLLLHCLINILEMASPALCIMYIPHISDMYPLGSLLYISCSFNVLNLNLICSLNSFREHLHVQSLLHLNMGVILAQWLELWPHRKKVPGWNLLGRWDLLGWSLCILVQSKFSYAT